MQSQTDGAKEVPSLSLAGLTLSCPFDDMLKDARRSKPFYSHRFSSRLSKTMSFLVEKNNIVLIYEPKWHRSTTGFTRFNDPNRAYIIKQIDAVS